MYIATCDSVFASTQRGEIGNGHSGHALRRSVRALAGGHAAEDAHEAVGVRYGSGRSGTASITLKIAVLAPMPSARVRIAIAVKLGVRTSARIARRTSRRRSSSHRMMSAPAPAQKARVQRV
jgi:hypothetical protein